MLLAVDPGRDKCGLAIVDVHGEIVQRRICPRSEAAAVARVLAGQHAVETIILGGATTSQAFEQELQRELPQASITVVDERNSTLEARALFWEAHPPRGWRRLVPLSLQTPLEPVDDFAAIVLARRYLGRR